MRYIALFFAAASFALACVCVYILFNVSDSIVFGITAVAALLACAAHLFAANGFKGRN